MKRNVVIVGAGFGGLTAAKRLARNENLEITIIDKKNHHLFQPLLYQVAMAGLSPAEIAVPIRSVFKGFTNVRVIMGEVESIDLAKQKVKGVFGDIAYDTLVLACGSEQSYFGREDWKAFAPGLKTLEEATDIRRRVLLAFEKAEREPNPDRQSELLTFVVVGGGPTGVELAGSIGEISRFTLKKEFRNLDPKKTKIYLLEGGPRILSSFDESLSRRAVEDLETLGVKVLTETRAQEIGADGVKTGDTFIPSKTVLWAAGVKPPAINEKLKMQGVALDQRGLVQVNADLTLQGHPNVFVIGDQAHVKGGVDGQPLPGLAPVAIQQGRFIANLISEGGQGQHEFKYKDKGQMATIGRSRAVAEAFGLKFGGFLAWLTWLVVHIFFLIGFRTRLFVFWEWSWSYLTYKRGARLIVGKTADQ